MQENNKCLDKNKKTVVVAMSGGVDSSVACLLLKQQGYNVVGLHMKGENIETRDADELRVRQLCEKFQIDCNVLDYQNEMQKVKDYFIQEYLSGNTPNPCVMCNREVKFKPFIEFAEKIGADYFATGHYAVVEHNGDVHTLKTAVDETKDQTYFLCRLSPDQIKKVLFPLGNYTKIEVRKIAEENGLISAKVKDSYDVCFLGSQKFKDFMDKNYPEKTGNIVDEKTGKVVGTHTGISKFTIGQRKGLGIGGGYGESGECWFVTRKDIKNNILYVTQGSADFLYSNALVSNDFNFITEPEHSEFECMAKFRYRQVPQKVKVVVQSKNQVYVEFAEKQRAVTVGQFVVLYDANICLGGGRIDEVIKN